MQYTSFESSSNLFLEIIAPVTRVSYYCKFYRTHLMCGCSANHTESVVCFFFSSIVRSH